MEETECLVGGAYLREDPFGRAPRLLRRAAPVVRVELAQGDRDLGRGRACVRSPFGFLSPGKRGYRGGAVAGLAVGARFRAWAWLGVIVVGLEVRR